MLFKKKNEQVHKIVFFIFLIVYYKRTICTKLYTVSTKQRKHVSFTTYKFAKQNTYGTMVLCMNFSSNESKACMKKKIQTKKYNHIFQVISGSGKCIFIMNFDYKSIMEIKVFINVFNLCIHNAVAGPH